MSSLVFTARSHLSFLGAPSNFLCLFGSLWMGHMSHWVGSAVAMAGFGTLGVTSLMTFGVTPKSTPGIHGLLGQPLPLAASPLHRDLHSSLFPCLLLPPPAPPPAGTPPPPFAEVVGAVASSVGLLAVVSVAAGSAFMHQGCDTEVWVAEVLAVVPVAAGSVFAHWGQPAKLQVAGAISSSLPMTVMTPHSWLQ